MASLHVQVNPGLNTLSSSSTRCPTCSSPSCLKEPVRSLLPSAHHLTSVENCTCGYQHNDQSGRCVRTSRSRQPPACPATIPPAVKELILWYSATCFRGFSPATYPLAIVEELIWVTTHVLSKKGLIKDCLQSQTCLLWQGEELLCGGSVKNYCVVTV